MAVITSELRSNRIIFVSRMARITSDCGARHRLPCMRSPIIQLASSLWQLARFYLFTSITKRYTFLYTRLYLALYLVLPCQLPTFTHQFSVGL